VKIVTVTPMDIHKGKFEAKVDDQLLPMDIDQETIVVQEKETKKSSMNASRSDPLKVTNPRAKAGRSSSELVQEIMQMPLTITVEEAVNMSWSVQQDLNLASKPHREGPSQAPEKTEGAEKNALGANVSLSSGKFGKGYTLGEPRDDLLIVTATVGKVEIPAVFDSGSQVNVLSDKWAKKCGLPVSTEHADRYRITGVNGGLAQCVGVIPNAKIYLGDNEFETIGDLIVVEHSGFDLLLGQPWAMINGGGLREADEGTYLIFKSRGYTYKVIISINPNFDEKANLQVARCARKVEG